MKPGATAMRLVIYPPAELDWLAEISSAGPELQVINAATYEEAVSAIPGAHAFCGQITPDLLEAAEQLRWIQARRIGLEHTVFPALLETDVVMTNLRGIYSDVIADHVLAYVLTFARGFLVYQRQQLEHLWVRNAPVIHLADSTLGIIGLGGIGAEVARRGAAFGMRVLAVDPRRTVETEGVALLWKPDRLDDLLACSDFVVVCAPHTPQTEGMIRTEQLRRMKRTAYLINVGRGVIVDLAALTEALQSSIIAGAGLDVFQIEPLPADSALWEMPNVVITPHAADRCAGDHIESRRRAIIVDNVRRFAAGEPLRNVVDIALWY
jgi:phosphoglycerate dehydrogenase-like enzyme